MNRNTIFIALATLLAGILAGYFLFGNRQPGDGNTGQEHAEVHAEEDHQIYTCSMHPQIRQNEPGTCPICGMDLIPLDESAQGSNPMVFQMTEDAVKLANIQTTIVGASQAATADRLKLNGRIQADETTASSIVTHIPGRIEQLYISYTGEEIKKGQKIATIYSPDLITAQKELLEAAKIASQNPALLEASINKLKYWKIDSTTIAGILSEKEIRQYFDIYSDHGGVVKNRKVAVGDYLMTGEVLFDIQNLDKLWALFDVYEEDLSKIKIGSRIQFTTPSLSAQTFRSSISFINPVIDPKTRVATIRAEINNQNRKLKPEMFITGELISTQTTHDRMIVPRTAVLWTGERSVVYVRIPDQTVPSYEFRTVTLGEPVGENYLVHEGILPGDEVVTNGAFIIDAAAQLNNQASMMNRRVGIKGQEVANDSLPDFTGTTPAAFQAQLMEVTRRYLAMKDALVDSDPEKTASLARVLMDSYASIDMSLLDAEQHDFWMMQLQALKAHTRNIAGTGDVEKQRNQFDFLSQTLITVLRVFGTDEDAIYVQHCPMANSNQGADWVSLDPVIRNPYFGDKMLTCGYITDTLSRALVQ